MNTAQFQKFAERQGITPVFSKVPTVMLPVVKGRENVDEGKEKVVKWVEVPRDQA